MSRVTPIPSSNSPEDGNTSDKKQTDGHISDPSRLLSPSAVQLRRLDGSATSKVNTESPEETKPHLDSNSSDGKSHPSFLAAESHITLNPSADATPTFCEKWFCCFGCFFKKKKNLPLWKEPKVCPVSLPMTPETKTSAKKPSGEEGDFDGSMTISPPSNGTKSRMLMHEKIKVLIVEDSKVNFRLLESSFLTEEFERVNPRDTSGKYQPVVNTYDAMHSIQTHKPEVIVLDNNLIDDSSGGVSIFSELITLQIYSNAKEFPVICCASNNNTTFKESINHAINTSELSDAQKDIIQSRVLSTSDYGIAKTITPACIAAIKYALEERAKQIAELGETKSDRSGSPAAGKGDGEGGSADSYRVRTATGTGEDSLLAGCTR